MAEVVPGHRLGDGRNERADGAGRCGCIPGSEFSQLPHLAHPRFGELRIVENEDGETAREFATMAHEWPTPVIPMPFSRCVSPARLFGLTRDLPSITRALPRQVRGRSEYLPTPP